MSLTHNLTQTQINGSINLTITGIDDIDTQFDTNANQWKYKLNLDTQFDTKILHYCITELDECYMELKL